MNKKYTTSLLIVLLFSQSLFCEESKSTRTAREVTSDKRLPPVIPGESVSDGKKSMKMWSTAGPVPVTKIERDVDSPNFELPRVGRKKNSRVNDQPINVIVDGRQ